MSFTLEGEAAAAFLERLLGSAAPQRDEVASPAEAAAFEEAVESRDQDRIAAAISPLASTRRLTAMMMGISTGDPSKDPKEALLASRGAFALGFAPHIRRSMIGMASNPGDRRSRMLFSSIARAWAMLYCPMEAYDQRGVLTVRPTSREVPSEGGGGPNVVMAPDEGLCVQFFPESEVHRFASGWSAKRIRRLTRMVRSYNVEHCHVVVVVHPTAGVFRPSYQLRYRGRVPQTVFRAEIARILLHSCDGDLDRECPLRDPASFAQYRVKTRKLFAQVTCGVDARFEPVACALCGTSVECPPRCGRCGTAYCSPKCQKDHWPAHKADCKRVAGEIAQGFDQLAETRALFIADGPADAAAEPAKVG